MASYRNIVLIALFFLIATAPRTHGIFIRGAAQVKVTGHLFCVAPGTLPTSSSLPLRRVSANITCNGGTFKVGEATTNTAGLLNATFNIPPGRPFDSSTCEGTVNPLGITGCHLFPPTGILHLTLVLVSIVDGVVQFVEGLIFI